VRGVNDDNVLAYVRLRPRRAASCLRHVRAARPSRRCGAL